MTPEFDIVIPHRGGDLRACMESIDKCSMDSRLRITVINNSKRDLGILGIWERTVDTLEDLGCTKSMNAGLALSTAPYVVLMNDDTEVRTVGWLEKMREKFVGGDQAVAAVGPVTNRSGPQKLELAPDRLEWVQATPTNFIGKMSFFCVMLSREAIVDIGYFDERFSPGYGDDDDWVGRAVTKGWSLAIHRGVFVHHEGGQSFSREERNELSERNMKRLKEKWNL